jgi:hypothetical protein
MKSRFVVGVSLAAIVIVANLGLTLLAAAPDPSQVYIQSITYGGSGCPQGSVSQSIANDRLSFTLIFDQYVASSGPAIPTTESRKNCQINLNLRVPQGAGNTILDLDYRGYVQLDAAGQASQGAAYYTNGTGHKQGGTSFAGPTAMDYLQQDTVPLHLQKVNVLSPCGVVVPVNLNTQVRIDAGDGQITTDSIDGSIKQTGKPKRNVC